MKTDDSLPKLTQQQIQKIKAKLTKRREELKNELRTKHAAAYKWLIEHQIDLDNLQKYSKNIAALVALTNQLLAGQQAFISLPKQTQALEMNKTEKEEKTALDEQNKDMEKAKKVWEEYGEIIEQVAKKYNLDPQLIFATIMTESEGDPNAYRYEKHIKDASFGLGQTLYSTAVKMGFTGKPEEIYRPEIAIDLIGKFHRNTLDTYGELPPERLTVVYNTGRLFGKPTAGHLARFKYWYYNYSKETTLKLPLV